jgi:phenylalanyl-tRNA synthetase alpha chain
MDINSIKAQLESDSQNVNSPETLEEFRTKYLGRKGALAQLTGSIPTLPAQERGQLGRQVNELKSTILAIIGEKQGLLSIPAGQPKKPANDISMPGVAQELGHLHPLTQVMEEICAVFSRMGFSVVEGPEIETEENNFTGLNIPLDHPSRDAFDTFYLRRQATGDRRHPTEHRLLLRSHTSPVQIRVMKTQKPPLAIVVPGRVYRPDAVDASHSFMFHQIEGLLVDEGIRFSDLKGVLKEFIKVVFGNDIKMRFRPHFFPFTEPSAEVDISCIICKGKGCSVCGRKGWLEILGSGMVHPNVFKHVGYDAKIYSGFAFGMGVERIAMLKYGINDIRLFFENDLRFLRQF